MPLTLTIAEGVIPAGREKVAFKRLSDAMLRWHGLTGNVFMTPNVTGAIHVVPAGHTFSGSEEKPVVFVEWKTPSFAFTDRAVQVGYVKEATDIVEEMAEGRVARANIYVNVVHGVDGAWAVNGRAMTNAELGEAAGAAARAVAA